MTSSSGPLLATIQSNLRSLQQRIAKAAQRAGRSPDTIRLVAVTKYASLEAVECLVSSCQTLLGENRPQQLIQRAEALSDLPKHGTTGESKGKHLSQNESTLQWHLIGPLQSNKIRSVLPWVSMIHSVESPKLIERISRVAAELELLPTLLLQVNVSGEESKGGFSPEEIRAAWSRCIDLPNVQIVGLMTMAPFTEDRELIRSTFRNLRELRDELQTQTPEHPLPELSMGMSHDFEIAIEEGATLVRIGSSLFEGCP